MNLPVWNDTMPDGDIFKEECERQISVPIEGKMYSVSLVVVDNERYLVKTLRSSLPGSSRYPLERSMEEIYRIHQQEHQVHLNFMPDIILPTVFFENTELEQFKTAQPFIFGELQFKDLLRRDVREVPTKQLPPIEERIDFIQRLTAMLNAIHPKLPDLDFFIYSDNNRTTHITVFDTSGFWISRDSKKRFELAYQLKTILFPNDEQRSDYLNQDLKGIMNDLSIYSNRPTP